ncbi:MAG: hypothetical protein R8G01_17480 [Ilumatobacteraceae bacterium]|nr:hypothetical protein [Ilumatobacteraceae bacterium]
MSAGLGFAALGRLPIVVPFAGFVMTLIAVSQITRLAPNSSWWFEAKCRLGLEAER